MRIVAAGYYGFGNLGDELILSVLLKQLKETYPGSKTVVLSNNPSHTRFFHGTQAVSRWNPFSVVWQLWRADLFVLGGGGLLQDKTSGRSLTYYMGLVFLALAARRPVFLYSIGVETVQRPFSKWLLRTLLSSRRVKITVRDQKSADTLAKIGITEKTIYVHQDPVFSLPVSVPEKNNSHELKRALFIPRFPAPTRGLSTYNEIRFFLEGRLGLAVDEALFEPSTEKKMRPTAVGIERLDQMVELLASCDLVVSARYHGLVLAALAGRPFIGVGDTEKNRPLVRNNENAFCGMGRDASRAGSGPGPVEPRRRPTGFS
jgi:polysaccharide pyruvyl transferase CsaB